MGASFFVSITPITPNPASRINSLQAVVFALLATCPKCQSMSVNVSECQ